MRYVSALWGNAKVVSFPEAPKNGKKYGRKDGTWSEIETISLPLSFQSLTAKDIEKGLAQSYDLIPKTREALALTSIVVECDNGTLTGCSLTINGTNVVLSGSSAFTISTTQTEINATSSNITGVGQRVKLNTSTGYTGTPTKIVVQLNYDKA